MISTRCIRPSWREAKGRRPLLAAFRVAVFITFLLMYTPLRISGQALDSEVKYQARDSIRYDLREQTVYLFGAATVKYEDVQLTADRISFSFKNEEATAFGVTDSLGVVGGKPNFVQGGHTIEADSIRYNFQTKQGLIREVRTQEKETWVHASTSKRHSNTEVHSKGGMLTTCDRPYPHYHFKVSKMIVIPDDKIVTGPAYMKFGRKIPTPLAVPFGFFPNKQGGSSGILIPVYGLSDQLGYYLLNGGYYLPISEHLDQQFTGDIYSRGSWALRSVTRYRTRYRFNGDLDLSRSVLLSSDPDFPDFTRQTNFFVRWNHLVDPRASLTNRFSAAVNVGTSANFTNNLNSSQFDYLSNTFQSNISWTRLWPGRPYNLNVNLRHSQNTLNRTFDFTLPAVNFNLTRIFPFQMVRPAGAKRRWYDQIGVNYSGNFENRLSTTEERLTSGDFSALAREMRNGVRHTAGVNTTLKSRYFTLNPEFRFTERWYFATLDQVYDSAVEDYARDTVQRFSRAGDWNMGATMTSKLYGMYTYRGERLQAIRHVITPSVGFNYLPNASTQRVVFAPDGTFTTYSPYDLGIFGKPPEQESGLVNLGLIQSLEAKVRDKTASATSDQATTSKKIRLIDFVGINTNYDLLRDSLNWAPVNLSARTAFFNKINVNYLSVWDTYATNELGQRIDRSERSLSGKLARMTFTNVAIGFDIQSRKYGQSVAGSAPAAVADRTVVEDSDPSRGAKLNFSLPWRLGINYSHDISRAYTQETFTETQRQSFLFNGDVTVLKYWKLGVSSGYDIVAEEWTPTSLNLYWDLHCWEFNLNVIPIGLRRSFTFRINVKASILRDMKYEQRRPIGNEGELLY